MFFYLNIIILVAILAAKLDSDITKSPETLSIQFLKPYNMGLDNKIVNIATLTSWQNHDFGPYQWPYWIQTSSNLLETQSIEFLDPQNVGLDTKFVVVANLLLFSWKNHNFGPFWWPYGIQTSSSLLETQSIEFLDPKNIGLDTKLDSLVLEIAEIDNFFLKWAAILKNAHKNLKLQALHCYHQFSVSGAIFPSKNWGQQLVPELSHSNPLSHRLMGIINSSQIRVSE